jgi:hypothetical protein
MLDRKSRLVLWQSTHRSIREPQVYTRIAGRNDVILCDLCGEAKECRQREINGREFDICADCWRPLQEKLSGKGRVKRKRDMVLLPPAAPPEGQPARPIPGKPPKIWGTAQIAPQLRCPAGRPIRAPQDGRPEHVAAEARQMAT